ncbi:peptide/nickel transport system permease protein [Albimonas donghaensis]|uniref:Peptide/nickel transport system permease protein n=1 Tax=Albimonas donghaensis TaxID=356660 RepID=A0A1H2RRY1_9RHOB|nr:ABC transporter permease [Albimonas donghaensis]MAS45724.1 ABC transporter permease [Paracoccaceae bacterium]MBR27314.1 ABC transporter permease [Paracoccaceae bacterium]SDW22232.1 peptide/nickel transport system permease protein [Albimonas donghaensis]
MLNQVQRRMLMRRVLQAIPVLILATFSVFMLLKMLPGDVAITLAGENATQERIEEIRTLYGLDRPLLVQYGDWVWGAVQGDLSKSLLSGEAVSDTLARVFPNTLFIVAYAILLAVLAGVPLGVLAASRAGGWADKLVMVFSSVGVALPNFWLAMIFVGAFALNRQWFPATGFTPASEDFGAAVWQATLPAVALAASGMAEVARQLRSSLVEVLESQHFRTLHAKGLSPRAILWKHGLRNVSVNLLTVISLLVNRTLAATVVVEVVFAIPGIGATIVDATLRRDFPVVQGVVLAMVVTVIVVNLIADMLYSVLDPRIAQR